MRAIHFVVYGVAQAQGSAKAFMPKGGRFPIVTSSNPKLRGWRHLVSDAAGRALAEAGGHFMEKGTAVRVVAEVYLPRPKALGKREAHHTKSPDVDKIARGLSDALSGVVFADDAQVVQFKVSKFYTAPGEAPHAVIVVTPL